MDDLNDLVGRYDALLHKIIACGAPVPAAFPCTLSTEEDLEKRPEFELKNVVYIITTEEIPSNFEALWHKAKEEDLPVAQLNYKDPGQCGSFKKQKCLYVGSSKEEVGTRLRQHLGFVGGNKTSALHFRKWWKTPAAFRVYLFKFDDSLEKTVPGGLQTIEDTIWDVCKPLLGKKGPRAAKSSTGKKKPRT